MATSIAEQYLITDTTAATTQLLYSMPDGFMGTIDIHILNLEAPVVQVQLWLTKGADTTLDESGVLERSTDLATGDNIRYSGCPIGSGQKLYIMALPLTTALPYKLSIQINGYKERE